MPVGYGPDAFAKQWETWLRRWAADVDELHHRYFRHPAEIQAGSEIDIEDRLTAELPMSQQLRRFIANGIDCLHGVRVVTLGRDDPETALIDLRTHVPFPLLRVTVEMACAAAWLLDPSVDREVRLERRALLLLDDTTMGNRVRALIGEEPKTLEESADFLDRVREAGVAIDAYLEKPKTRMPTKSEIVVAGAAVIAAERLSKVRADSVEGAWRGLSGASHGDLWATMTFHAYVPIPGATGSFEVLTTPKTLVVWTWNATEAFLSMLRLYDRARVTWKDTPPAT